MSEEAPGAAIGRTVRRLREAGMWTRGELSERAGVSKQTIAHLERGVSDRPRRTTLEKIASVLGVEVEALIAAAEVADTPLGENPSSPDEWARSVGARLHGMSDPEWSAYFRSLETGPEVEEAFRALSNERVMLHAAMRADKWIRPENRARRAELMPGIREVRIRRMADLEGAASLRRAEALVDEIHEALLQEAHS